MPYGCHICGECRTARSRNGLKSLPVYDQCSSLRGNTPIPLIGPQSAYQYLHPIDRGHIERFAMDKTKKKVEEAEAFEMIELSVADVESLARAFRMITDVANELNAVVEVEEPAEEIATEAIVH